MAAYSSDSPRTQRRKGLSQLKGENGQRDRSRSIDSGCGSGGNRERSDSGRRTGGGSGLVPRDRGRQRERQRSRAPDPAGWGMKENYGNAAITSITQQHPGCLEVAAAVRASERERRPTTLPLPPPTHAARTHARTCVFPQLPVCSRPHDFLLRFPPRSFWTRHVACVYAGSYRVPGNSLPRVRPFAFANVNPPPFPIFLSAGVTFLVYL